MRFKKYKDLIIAPERVVDQFSEHKPFHPRMQAWGEVKLVLRDLNGRFLTETPWGPNLLTNTGVSNRLSAGTSTSSWNHAHISSDATPPLTTDSSLAGWMGSGTALDGTKANELPTALNSYTAWVQEAWRIYGGTGTIQKIGISGSSSNSGMIIIAPVTVPLAKTADQVVDVYHRMHQQYDTTDQAGVVNIAGDDFNYKAGMYRLEQATGESARLAAVPFSGYNTYYYSNVKLREDGDHTAWGLMGDGLGTYDDDYADNADTFVYDTSTIASLGYGSVTVVCDVGLTSCNTIGSPAYNGIKGIFFQANSSDLHKIGMFVSLSKISDGTGLFKDETQTLNFFWGASYGRAGSLLP